jgi:hypothetical protein
VLVGGGILLGADLVCQGNEKLPECLKKGQKKRAFFGRTGDISSERTSKAKASFLKRLSKEPYLETNKQQEMKY